MIHNETFEIKMSRNGKKSTQSFIYQPYSAMFRKAIIKVTKISTNDKQPLHEPRTKKHEKGFYDFSFPKTFEKTEPHYIPSFLLQVLNAKLLR